MRVELLGPLRVVADDGHDLTPRGEQQRRALTALAAHAPAPTSVDLLEELLWGGAPPSANALQALVSKLRKVVAPATIDAVGGGYALRGDVVRDVDEFERLLRTGEFAAAERLVRGGPLGELGDDLAMSAERARLNGLVRTARYKRLAAQVAGLQPIDAVAELEAMVAAEPVDEQWWVLLMDAYRRCGQQAEALRTFQRAVRNLAEHLGLGPGPELRRIEREVLDGVASVDATTTPATSAVWRRRSGLPARLTSFVGRHDDLDALASAVASHRLVTVVGPGGTGKTAAALEVGRRLDSAAFVALAPLLDGDSIVHAIARAVGLPEAEQPALAGQARDGIVLERLLDQLVASSMTIVLDNCEHVLDTVAPLVRQLLEHTTSISVLATGRGSLGVPGEYVYPLAPLVPDDAVALLRARALDHAATAAIDAADPGDVELLCDRLDRLPLAIELAAARLRSLSVEELIERLADRFALLSAGPRAAEPRQQTLRAVVDWSHDLLDAEEQRLFRLLSMFVGGATPAAIEAVAGTRGGDPMGVVDRLLDKSLIRAERTLDGTRYSMLQTLHDYATERLLESGERESVVARHAEYFAQWLVEAERQVLGREQPRWLRMISRELQNIESASATAIARHDAQLALELNAPLGWYRFMTGDFPRGIEMFAEALACPGEVEPSLRASALAQYGWLLANGSSLELAVASTSAAVALLDRVDDPYVRGMILNTHAMAQFFAGHVDRSLDTLATLKELSDTSPDRWVRAITRLVVGELLQFMGRQAEAEAAFSAAAVALEQLGDRFGYSLAITEGAELAELTGDYDRAAALLERGIALADEVGFSGHPLAMKARLGNVEVLRGNFDAARAHHAELIDDPIAQSVPWLRAMSLIGLSSIERREGGFDTARRLLDELAAMPRARTVPYLRSMVHVAAGYLADQLGDAPTALASQLAGLQVARGLRAPRNLAYSLEGCAGALALFAEHAVLGSRLLGAADALRRGSGGAMPPAERFDVDRAEGRLRELLGDEAFDAAFASGALADAQALISDALALA